MVITIPLETNNIIAMEKQAQPKLIIMSFGAPWCSVCQQMKSTTWSNPQLKKYIQDNNIELHHINTDKDSQMAKQYGVSSIPCVVVLERISETNAKEIDRFIGLRNSKDVVEFIERCKNKNEKLFTVIDRGLNIPK